MPRLVKKLPSYRLHRPSGRAIVTLNGRDHYLGAWGSPESRAEYDRLVAEWLAAGRGRAASDVAPSPDGPTVAEVILAYWKHAEAHYRDPDGRPTHELDNMRDALKPVRRLYGKAPARTFGPLALRAVRDAMVRSGLARTTVNARVNRVRRVFRWAASVELVPGSVPESLRTLDGLREGRTEAREPAPVAPVPIERVEAVLPLLSRPVAAMVRLQLLCGCRAGEVVVMRGRDLTPGDPTWEYRPGRHKNRWRGRGRVIPLGPRAQAIVREFLKPDLDACLFAPADAARERRERRRAARKSRPTPSEMARRARDPGRGLAPRYDRRSYRQAIVRACDAAFPHPTLAGVAPADLTPEQRAELKAWRCSHRWSPLQLRHTAATTIRAQYGLEAAQLLLGHAKADVTQLYAEKDLARARAIAVEVG